MREDAVQPIALSPAPVQPPEMFAPDLQAEVSQVLSPYPPIAEYAFLSDCETVALVAPSSAVEWLCLPGSTRRACSVPCSTATPATSA